MFVEEALEPAAKHPLSAERPATEGKIASKLTI
jgi:hypothetical protein